MENNQFALVNGTKLQDRYRIDEMLGSNGISITYKAFDTFRENPVVIKELYPAAIVERNKNDGVTVSCMLMSHEADFLKMKEHMAKEATTMIKLYPLPAVANIITYFEENQTLYLVTEYIEGTPLPKYVKGTSLTIFQVRDARKLLYPIMKDLAKLHEKGVVHGKINPSLIYYTKNRGAVLLGFGDPMEDAALAVLENATARVPGYAPVEQYIDQGGFGPATDIYAIAAIIYELVTNTKIPEFYERFNEIQKSGNDLLIPPVQLNPRIMQIQSTVIMVGLNIYHFDRYQDIMEFADSLSDDDFSDDKVVITNQIPLWMKVLNRYNALVKILLIVFILVMVFFFVPKFKSIATTETAEHYYRTIETGDINTICQTVVELKQKNRAEYANDYSVMEESGDTEVYYYNLITKRYEVIKEVPEAKNRVRYIRADYRLNNTAIITMVNDGEIRILTVHLKKNQSGEYRVDEEIHGSKEASNVYYVKF